MKFFFFLIDCIIIIIIWYNQNIKQGWCLFLFFFLSIYPIWLVLHLKQHCTKMHQRNLCAQKDRRRLRLLLWKESDSFNLFLLYIISKTSAHARVSMMLSEKKEFFFRKILPFAPPPPMWRRKVKISLFFFLNFVLLHVSTLENIWNVILNIIFINKIF